MKRANLILLNLLITLFLLAPIIPTLAQENNDFKWLHPKPVGIELRWVKMWDANNWYVGGNGMTFMKTSNGGNTWDTRNSFLLGENNESLEFADMEFINMNTGYACGLRGKFFKTTNAGETWDSMTVGSTSALWFDMYWVDQMTCIMSGLKPNVAMLTTDGGATWTQPGTPPNYTAYSVYAFSKDSILLSCEQGRVLRTIDGGANWTTITTLSGIHLRKINFINNSTGYICGSSRNVRMTTNFGSNWTLLNSGLPNLFYYDIDFKTISDSTYIYITGSPLDIYKSKIGTNNWEALSIEDTSTQYNGYMLSSDLSVTGDTIITCGGRGFINVRYGSSDIKAFTKYVNMNYRHDIWSDGDGRIIAVGDEDDENDQSMYSTDGGDTWQLSTVTGTQETFFRISMVNSTTGYASSYGRVYKTTTGGTEWTETTQLSSGGDYYDVSFVNVNTGYTVGEDGNCFKTTNGGANWTAFSWGGAGTDDALSCSFINANTGWIGGYDGQLFKTTNGGATTFAQVSSEYDIIKLDMIDANTGWLANDEYAMKTTNGGTLWDTLQFPFSDVYPEDLDFVDDMNGIVLDYKGTVYKTTDGGNTWDVGNVSSYEVQSIYMVSPTEAYITGQYSQVFGYKDIISGTELTYNNSVPTDHYLEQNYPNPFNPTTTIKFGIPRQGLVSLKVYDMSGREVANLIDNKQMNAGQVSKQFNGSSLSSGVYFYSLVVNGQMIATKKMVLVK